MSIGLRDWVQVVKLNESPYKAHGQEALAHGIAAPKILAWY